MITYKQWIDGTKRNIFTPRSKKLEAIDTALETYDTKVKTQAQLKTVAEKLKAWIEFKGPDWRKSTRNTNGTVDQLYNDLALALGPGFAMMMAGAAAPAKQPLKVTPIQPVANPGIKITNIAAAGGFAGVVGTAKVHEHQVKEAYARLSGLAAQCRDAMLKIGKDQIEMDRFERWFGDFDDQRAKNVRAVFQKMSNALAQNGATVTVDTAGDPSWYAYVKTDDPPPLKIYLCKQFFTGLGGPLSERYKRSSDATVVTLLHECTHIPWIGAHDGEGITDVDYDGETMYGVANCEKLATEKPEWAEFNADNYAFYGLSLITAV